MLIGHRKVVSVKTLEKIDIAMCVESKSLQFADRPISSDEGGRSEERQFLVFHLYIGPQAELLKRLAESQSIGKARHSGGSTTHIQGAVNDPHPIYSTRS